MTEPADQQAFVARYGDVYEHSPWVATDSWLSGRGAIGAVELADIFARTVDAAPHARKLALIRAHPDLAGRIARAGALSAESTAEQTSAGLDRCSEEEYRQFQKLNAEYVRRFEFPFVMAVQGSNRADILAAFRRRLQNDYDDEFDTAIAEIHKIARLRLHLPC